MATDELIGIGLYTPAEAGRLIGVAPSKLARWLRGHKVGEKTYPALWQSEVSLGDGRVYLGFRDLMEARVVSAFIKAGISPLKIRSAIALAREAIGSGHPLSTNQFRTDGREIFLQVEENATGEALEPRLLNLFKRQYEFKGFLDPILKSVDFGADGAPTLWWPGGRRLGVVIDPARSFGQPIDVESSVPTSLLAASARLHGNSRGAALDYGVSEKSVRNALEFENRMEERLAA